MSLTLFYSVSQQFFSRRFWWTAPDSFPDRRFLQRSTRWDPCGNSLRMVETSLLISPFLEAEETRCTKKTRGTLAFLSQR